MAKVKIVIIHGPNYEEYRLGSFDIEIVPRTGESIFCDIGSDYDPVIFSVMDVKHFIGPECATEVHITPSDEKAFEDAKLEKGFRWSGKSE